MLYRTELNKAVRGPLEEQKAPRVIAVSSGKGGVGKTNLAANLGICLAREGKEVVVLDADLGTANVDVLLGIAPVYSFYDVINGEKSLQEIIVTGPAGIKLIPGGSGFEEFVCASSIQKEQVEKHLHDLTWKHDFLLIDTGAGLSRNVLSFISAASEVIVVVTPEPTSIADAYSLIKVLLRFGINRRIHLVVNMASGEREARGTAEKITQATRHFLGSEIHFLGAVFSDNSVGQAVREQVPFVVKFPQCRASIQTRAVAEALLGACSEELAAERFVTRLVRLFG